MCGGPCVVVEGPTRVDEGWLRVMVEGLGDRVCVQVKETGGLTDGLRTDEELIHLKHFLRQKS